MPTPLGHDLASVFDFVPQYWDEEDTANPEERKRRERRFNAFYQFVADLPKTADNEQVYQIICICRDEGIFKRSAIADRLGISPEAVTNAYRRLDTIIIKFLEAQPETEADDN